MIDAHGGAAFFEAGVKGFTRFDAGDQATAPNGVLVRTNFSVSGDTTQGSGWLRRHRRRSPAGAPPALTQRGA